jgi:hypothetical protein
MQQEQGSEPAEGRNDIGTEPKEEFPSSPGYRPQPADAPAPTDGTDAVERIRGNRPDPANEGSHERDSEPHSTPAVPADGTEPDLGDPEEPHS